MRAQHLHHRIVYGAIGEALYDGQVVEERPEIEESGACAVRVRHSERVPGAQTRARTVQPPGGGPTMAAARPSGPPRRGEAVKFGVFGINVGACASPQTAAKVARAAERAGFESVWTGEHVVLPDPQVAPSPLPPRTPMLDPAVALTWVAAHTESIRLGTGIIILPQRNPVVLAKELASLDVLSGGRLLFGIGAGYLEAEFSAARRAVRGARRAL